MKSKKATTINVSLADVSIAYIVVFSKKVPSDMRFDCAAQEIVAALPGHWQRLMEIVIAARVARDVMTPYEETAEDVRALIEANGDLGTCRWFALCTNNAIGAEPHPALKFVPICAKCKARVASMG
jgi:hypothetical protein